MDNKLKRITNNTMSRVNKSNQYYNNRKNDLKENKAKRTPICIVVDMSRSMFTRDFSYRGDERQRIERFNDGIKVFLDEVKADKRIEDSAEIAIVGYGYQASWISMFEPIYNIDEIVLAATGEAGNMGAGVLKGVEILKKEKEFLRENRIKYNQPWLVIFSDGKATGGKEVEPKVVRETLDKAVESIDEKFTVIPVLINFEEDKVNSNDLTKFAKFSGDKVYSLASHNSSFRDFFKVLEKSISIGADQLVEDDNKTSIDEINEDTIENNNEFNYWNDDELDEDEYSNDESKEEYEEPLKEEKTIIKEELIEEEEEEIIEEPIVIKKDVTEYNDDVSYADENYGVIESSNELVEEEVLSELEEDVASISPSMDYIEDDEDSVSVDEEEEYEEVKEDNPYEDDDFKKLLSGIGDFDDE